MIPFRTTPNHAVCPVKAEKSHLVKGRKSLLSLAKSGEFCAAAYQILRFGESGGVLTGVVQFIEPDVHDGPRPDFLLV